MDGERLRSRIDAMRRRAVALALLSVATTPLALMTFDEGARADETPASIRYAPGTPAMLAAQDVARRTWGVDPCDGRVDVSWATDDPSVNARSSWANPQSAYGAPQLNVQCRIVLNGTLVFDWSKFCTVLVHEYGHLAGHPHDDDGPGVMSPIYRAPLPACSAPTALAAAPASAPPASASRKARRLGGARTPTAKARAAAPESDVRWFFTAHD
jgi:hypothetical protein